MAVYDVRDQLPLAWFSYGTWGPKRGVTVHWNGGPVHEDVGPLEVILGDAHFHIDSRGWDGISYHRLYARNGDVYITRNPDAILAACGDEVGNREHSHWQVMCGIRRNADGVVIEYQPPTPEQLRVLARDLAGVTDRRPHGGPGGWSATECPGEALTNFIASPMEDDMTDAERRALAALAKRPDLAEALVENADTVLYVLRGTEGDVASLGGYQVGSYGHTVERLVAVERALSGDSTEVADAVLEVIAARITRR